MRLPALAVLILLAAPLSAQQAGVTGAEEPTVTLEVVDGPTGDPVPGALVFVQSMAELYSAPGKSLRSELNRRYQSDDWRVLPVLAARFGRQLTTDEEGRAVVTCPEGGTEILASAEDRIGQVQLSGREGEPVRVQLWPRTFIDTVVHDAGGRPIEGLPLELLTGSPRMAFLRARVTTDAGGRARLPVPFASLARDQTVLRRAAVAMAEPPGRWLRARDFAAGGKPESLALPPCGQLRVIVYGEDERPAPAIARMKLRSLDPRASRGAGDLQRLLPVTQQADNAVWWVALGSHFEAEVWLRGVGGSLRVRGKGPVREREMVVLSVRQTRSAPILAMQLVDAAAQPVADEEVGILFATKERQEGRILRTDADGVVEIVAMSSFRDHDTMLTVLRRGPGPMCVYRGAAHRPLPGDLKPGRNDLGTLVLVEEPILVAGRVLDDRGQPVAHAELASRTFYSAADGSSSGLSASPFFSHKVRSDAEGRFCIRELGRAGQYLEVELSVQKPGSYLLEPARFRPGTADARIVLGRAARLVGSFRELPAATFPATLHVVPGRGAWDVNRAAPDRVGRFEFHDLAPGRHALEIRSLADEVLLRIEDLVLEPGATCVEPRVQGIDWRRLWRPVTVTLVRPDGSPAAGASVCLWQKKPDRGWSTAISQTGPDGTRCLLVPHAGVGIEILTDEFRAVRMTAVREDQRVVLAPRPAVELRLGKGVELPDDVRLVARLELDRAALPDAWGHGYLPLVEAPFDAGGVARLALPDAVPCRLTVMGRMSIPGSEHARVFHALPSLAQPVRVGDEVTRVALPLSRDLLDELADNIATARAR